MFDSSFEKIVGVSVVTAIVFVAGYYKGYSAEHEKFIAFQAEVRAKAQVQQEQVKKTEQKQTNITEGIKNEYQAKISALELRYGRLHNGSNQQPMPSVPNASGRADEAPANEVLACAITTQQLVSLQDWIKLQLMIQ